MQDITSLLTNLDFDAEDTKTYLLLLETGSVTAGKLAKKLGVPRSSLYGFLKKLTDRGLVTESQRGGIKQFTAENPEKLNQLFTEKIEQLTRDQNEYKKLLPELRNTTKAKLLTPKLQLFEGADGLKQVLKDMLLYYDMETYAFWPIQNMLDILGKDFFHYLNKERIKNKLYTKAIWPSGQVISQKQHPYLGSGVDFFREIRVAPKDIHIDMGYWIYGNKVACISSRKESFGFIVESIEFTNMLKVQFNVLWQLSTPLPHNPADTKLFIDELRRYA